MKTIKINKRYEIDIFEETGTLKIWKKTRGKYEAAFSTSIPKELAKNLCKKDEAKQ